MWCIVFFMCVCVCATMLCMHLWLGIESPRYIPKPRSWKGKVLNPSLSYIWQTRACGTGGFLTNSVPILLSIVLRIFLQSQSHITHLWSVSSQHCAVLRLVSYLDLSLFDAEKSNLRSAVGDLGLRLPCKKALASSQKNHPFSPRILYIAQLP